ncbi:hypothetical protein BG004_005894 [Podila humilis]|nr:hypothetical protein BG004_005894 [Podila humilis]
MVRDLVRRCLLKNEPRVGKQRSATIKIVQQPLHARMCGFGEKDRRPVDPPPVVQLVLQDGPDPEYNLFKLPQKKKLSAAAKRKKALALGAAATVVVAKKKIREGASKRKTGMDSDSDHRDVAEGDDDLNEPDRASESECAGSDSEDEDEDEKKHHTGPRSQRDHKGHISPISIEEVPRWEDFYENLDTGAIPLAQDPLFVLSCSLWSHDGTEVRNMVSTSSGGVSGHGNSSGAASHKRDKLTTSCQTVNPSARPPKLTRILMGSVVVSPILLFNDKGEQGWYFSFPDLSIRTEGVYTLKFSLIRLGRYHSPIHQCLS